MKGIDLFDFSHVSIKGLPFVQKNHLNRFSKEDFFAITQENQALEFLSYHLAGGIIFFETDAKILRFEIKYHNEPLMNHMSPLGESGFDLYILMDQKFIFYDSIRPFPRQKGLDVMMKLPNQNSNVVMIYTPNYARVNEARLMIEKNEFVKPYDPHFKKRIFFYGTSITQGACASRPGLSYTNQLSRMLNVEMINMGFSGNGLGELSVAKITHKLPDLDMVVIDYEANAGAVGKLKETLISFIQCIREVHHHIPIVILGRIPFTRELFDKNDQEKRLYHRQYQQSVSHMEELKPISFIDGESLILSNEHEFTVDGIHLNDLGMTYFSQRLAPYLSDLLNGDKI